MKKSLLLAVVLLFGCAELLAQSSRFRVAIVAEMVGGSRRDTIWVGVSGDGPGGTIIDNTYGVDDNAQFGGYGLFREAAAPPDPPQVFLYQKFEDVPGRSGQGFSRPWDYRGYTSLSQVDTFAFRVYGDSVLENGVRLRWASNLGSFGTAWTMKPRTGTAFTDVNMLTSNTLLLPAGGPYRILVIKTGLFPVGVKEIDRSVPAAYALEQNYPNPFNPSTEIRFRVAESGPVRLTVYNLVGEAVATLVNEVKAAGTYSVTFDASGIASGVYLYRMESMGFSDVKKLLLVR
jgi:hypothetical protein